MPLNPIRAFRKRGNTVVLNIGGATALAAVSFTALDQITDGIDFLVNNGESFTVYLAFDSTPSGAQAKAVIPATAASQDVYVCLAGTVQIFHEGAKMFAAGVATAAADKVYITPGEGA